METDIRSHMLALRLTAEEFALLRDAARAEGCTVSDYVRGHVFAAARRIQGVTASPTP